MSRQYSMYVSIAALNPTRSQAIRSAAQEEWSFSDWFEHEEVLATSGESSLAGGETEEEFAARLAKAIWKANGGFCQVEVSATYLEDLPYELYAFDEEDFEEMMSGAELVDGSDAAAKEVRDG